MKNLCKITLISVLTALISFACGQPADSEESILNQIRIHVNNFEFKEAIDLFGKVKTKNEEISVLKAEANAGLGGFLFFSVIDNALSNPSLKNFDFIYNLSSSSDQEKITSLKNAIFIIESDINKVTRSGKNDLKYSFFNFFYSSLILRKYFNSSTEISFDPCNDNQFPSSAVKEMIISINKGADAINLAIAKEKLTRLNSVSSDLNSIATLTESNAYKFFESEVTAQDITDFRSSLKTTLVQTGAFCN